MCLPAARSAVAHKRTWLLLAWRTSAALDARAPVIRGTDLSTIGGIGCEAGAGLPELGRRDRCGSAELTLGSWVTAEPSELA